MAVDHRRPPLDGLPRYSPRGSQRSELALEERPRAVQGQRVEGLSLDGLSRLRRGHWQAPEGSDGVVIAGSPGSLRCGKFGAGSQVSLGLRGARTLGTARRLFRRGAR